MSRLKKFLIVFFSFLPFGGASAFVWQAIGILAGITAIAGYSIYRSNVPVDMSGALDFFSSCWTCNVFSSILGSLSNVLTKIYINIGEIMIPIAIMLVVIYFTWTLLSGFLNANIKGPMGIAEEFTTYVIKLMIISTLLIVPLPRIISDVAIEPITSIGLSTNHIMGDSQRFTECVVATSLLDGNIEKNSIIENPKNKGAFSKKLRSGLTCELANLHYMTGMGMTVGWAMMNMSFDHDYMHRIMFDIPISPNIPILLAGILILGLFFWAFLPIPLYFLEIFVTLSLDLIMLPLTLMGWLFPNWEIFKSKGKPIKTMIDDVIKGTVGIAICVVFLTLAMTFVDTIVGRFGGIELAQMAIEQNDPTILMDGLMLRNDSLISIIIMGLFFMLFMTSVPALAKSLFSIDISDKFYKTMKSDTGNIGKFLGKWWDLIKK